MAWQSASFHKPPQPAENADKKKISESADKHRSAMNRVVKEARELAKDSRETLGQIQDPQLRRSAAR
jgi:deoxycytidine triphosphate deaminase